MSVCMYASMCVAIHRPYIHTQVKRSIIQMHGWQSIGGYNVVMRGCMPNIDRSTSGQVKNLTMLAPK